MIEDEVLKYFIQHKYVLTREDDPSVWRMYLQVRHADSFLEKQDVYGFDLYEPKSGEDKVYLVRRDADSVFGVSNAELKKDAGSDVSNYDKLYLLKFVCLYFFLEFCTGEGENPIVRDFITLEDFMSDLNSFCRKVELAEEEASDVYAEYGVNFIHYMREWNSKGEGSPSDTASMATRYSIMKKAFRFMTEKGLAAERADGSYTVGKRTKDLAPYTLRKDREKAIKKWFVEVDGLCQG